MTMMHGWGPNDWWVVMRALYLLGRWLVDRHSCRRRVDGRRGTAMQTMGRGSRSGSWTISALHADHACWR